MSIFPGKPLQLPIGAEHHAAVVAKLQQAVKERDDAIERANRMTNNTKALEDCRTSAKRAATIADNKRREHQNERDRLKEQNADLCRKAAELVGLLEDRDDLRDEVTNALDAMRATIVANGDRS